MRYQTTDLITGNDVTSLETAPFVIEGSNEDALKIYFKSEQSKNAYLDTDFEELRWSQRQNI